MEELDATQQYIVSGDKRLRCGFTTGSCAAMASYASVVLMLSGKCPEEVSIKTPKGWIAKARPVMDDISFNNGIYRTGIKKDSGDDPDITNGIMIYASCRISSYGGTDVSVNITGGTGVGVVTKDGLDQHKGSYAINRVPRLMIKDSVCKAAALYDFKGVIDVIIDVPDGIDVSSNTFNPVLGIENGISILGTSGVVEPMSESALIQSIEIEVKVKASELKNKTVRPLVIIPGNYGQDFINSRIEFKDIPYIRCSNYIGQAVDFAGMYGFTHVILCGHAGKFVKLAGGIMNTHSHNADCRLELIALCAGLSGADVGVMSRILGCATVEAALSVTDMYGITDRVVSLLIKKACSHLQRRIKNRFQLGLIMFTNDRGIIGESDGLNFLLQQIKSN